MLTLTNLCIEVLEASQIRLIRRQLREHTLLNCEGHKRKDDILLATKITQTPIFAIRRFERKVGSNIAHFERLRLCTIFDCPFSRSSIKTIRNIGPFWGYCYSRDWLHPVFV